MGYSLETRCIHGEDHRVVDEYRAISTPIYQTSSFSHIKPGHNLSGFDYSRESNPTRAHLEETMASLENAADCVAFASGMAAITACFELFSQGDHILMSDDLYGGVVRLVHNIEEKNGLKITFTDTSDTDNLKNLMTSKTKALYVESPSNPMMHVADLKKCGRIAHEAGALFIVDNTFLSPYFMTPMDLGADIVLHSGSKFISGHNDTICGFLSSKDPEIAKKVRLIAKTLGSTLGPLECWLAERGLKTLHVRMERHQENACAIAEWLKTRTWVKKVFYVGDPEHPGHNKVKEQGRGFGSMISFETDTKERALAILQNVKLITFAESLGGTETLITYPDVQTHADVPQSVKDALGINDRLLRLSVGLENVKDLIEDLERSVSIAES
jgi:cystathionine beta-lyase/cystathionine gamma-synthase